MGPLTSACTWVLNLDEDLIAAEVHRSTTVNTTLVQSAIRPKVLTLNLVSSGAVECPLLRGWRALYFPLVQDPTEGRKTLIRRSSCTGGDSMELGR